MSCLPSRRIVTRPEDSGAFACWMNSIPSSKIFLTGVPQLIIPLVKKWSKASALVPNALGQKYSSLLSAVFTKLWIKNICWIYNVLKFSCIFILISFISFSFNLIFYVIICWIYCLRNFILYIRSLKGSDFLQSKVFFTNKWMAKNLFLITSSRFDNTEILKKLFDCYEKQLAISKILTKLHFIFLP